MYLKPSQIDTWLKTVAGFLYHMVKETLLFKFQCRLHYSSLFLEDFWSEMFIFHVKLSWRTGSYLRFKIITNIILIHRFRCFLWFSSSLTHFSPMSHFYTPWKRQKTCGFLTFSGGIEMWHWTKIGLFITWNLLFARCTPNAKIKLYKHY